MFYSQSMLIISMLISNLLKVRIGSYIKCYHICIYVSLMLIRAAFYCEISLLFKIKKLLTYFSILFL